MRFFRKTFPFAKSSVPFDSTKQNIRNKVLFRAFAAVGVTSLIYIYNKEEVDLTAWGLARSTRTAVTASKIIIDYLITLKLRPQFISYSEQELLLLKSKCHERSASSLLQLCKNNGGIYIKLGQHISALVYLFPVEYTSIMQVLQDKCPPTPFQDIEDMFLQDMNVPISDVFSEFNAIPIGVASLAQVYHAKLNTGQEVAVKLQVIHHPTQIRFTL